MSNGPMMPGGPQRQRWRGPSILVALPFLAPGMVRQAAPLLWIGGLFLFGVLGLFTARDPAAVQLIVAVQISLLLLLLISVASGRRKSIMSFAGAFVIEIIAMATILQLMISNMFDDEPYLGQSSLGLPLLRLIFGVGIREELIKALPVFLMAALAGWSRAPRWLVVRDPVDGLLIGAASGVAFTLVETLRYYVPDIMREAAYAGAGVETQGYYGLTLLLPRVLSSIGGHVAWSGFFGYMIGLARAYPPQRRPLTLLIGLAVAAVLHALWDDFGDITRDGPQLFLIAMVSYALLVTAVLSARQRAAGGVVAAAGLWLNIGAKRYNLAPGTVLTVTDLPGLQPQAPGFVVASVQRNSTSPGVLGLRNDSRQTWDARPVNRPATTVPTGRTVRLTPGLTLRFGATNGNVG